MEDTTLIGAVKARLFCMRDAGAIVQFNWSILYGVHIVTVKINDAPWSAIMTFCAPIFEYGYGYLESATQDRVIIRMFPKAYRKDI